MDNLLKYQTFFALRDEYPEHCHLLSELISFAFQHEDSFLETTYINGQFQEDDVKFIFEKLNLSIPKKVITTNLRNENFTILVFSSDVQTLP